jgi:hypothetical protein
MYSRIAATLLSSALSFKKSSIFRSHIGHGPWQRGLRNQTAFGRHRLSLEQMKILEMVLSGKSLFFTGPAGECRTIL